MAYRRVEDPRPPARGGRGGVAIRGEKAAACGWLYVAGRQAASLDHYTIHGDVITFDVVLSTVDPFWSRYGPVSHVCLWYRAQHWLYRVQRGRVEDGRVTFTWPSWLRMREHPGARLPQL